MNTEQMNTLIPTVDQVRKYGTQSTEEDGPIQPSWYNEELEHIVTAVAIVLAYDTSATGLIDPERAIGYAKDIQTVMKLSKEEIMKSAPLCSMNLDDRLLTLRLGIYLGNIAKNY